MLSKLFKVNRQANMPFAGDIDMENNEVMDQFSSRAESPYGYLRARASSSWLRQAFRVTQLDL
jgi:hypothetical protein